MPEYYFDNAERRMLMSRLESLTPQEYSKLKTIEELVGRSVTRWPKWARTLMLDKRLHHNGRYSLYVFLAGNILPPELFVEW